MRRELGRDHRLDVAILAVQPTEEVEDLARLRDGLSDVAQAISEELEAGAVVRDAEVALVEAAELSLQVDGALEFMVAEEALDVRPKGERGGARLVDDVEDVLVDGGVQPVDDAAVDLAPFGVALRHGRRSLDDVIEAELAEDGVEAAPPLAIVGVQEIEKDGDV